MKLKRWQVGLSIGSGLTMAILVLRVAFIHNPQGEFFDPESGNVEWVYSAFLFGLWFIAGAACGLVAGALIRVLSATVRK